MHFLKKIFICHSIHAEDVLIYSIFLSTFLFILVFNAFIVLISVLPQKSLGF